MVLVIFWNKIYQEITPLACCRRLSPPFWLILEQSAIIWHQRFLNNFENGVGTLDFS